MRPPTITNTIAAPYTREDILAALPTVAHLKQHAKEIGSRSVAYDRYIRRAEWVESIHLHYQSFGPTIALDKELRVLNVGDWVVIDSYNTLRHSPPEQVLSIKSNGGFSFQMETSNPILDTRRSELMIDTRYSSWVKLISPIWASQYKGFHVGQVYLDLPNAERYCPISPKSIPRHIFYQCWGIRMTSTTPPLAWLSCRNGSYWPIELPTTAISSDLYPGIGPETNYLWLEGHKGFPD